MTKKRVSHLDIYNLKHFHVETLKVSSSYLKGNPLKDPHIRSNPVLVPKKKASQEGYPVILVLAGFTGNGPKYFGPKTFEKNFPEMVDQHFTDKDAPEALYVFVDAMTLWGGSQFLDSSGCGKYESYFVKELMPAIEKSYKVSEYSDRWCVMGGSSGGYGALHLSSKYPQHFGFAAAIAPDSFFERSLLPDVYSAAPTILRFGGIEGVKEALLKGEFHKRRDAHTVLNALGMSACYGGLPINLKTGELKKAVWKRWLEKDPTVFLKKRRMQLKKLDGLFLEVGNRDQYSLQYGARQIHQFLKSAKIPHHFKEFDGSHWDIGERRVEVWRWLKAHWS